MRIHSWVKAPLNGALSRNVAGLVTQAKLFALKSR